MAGSGDGDGEGSGIGGRRKREGVTILNPKPAKDTANVGRSDVPASPGWVPEGFKAG